MAAERDAEPGDNYPAVPADLQVWVSLMSFAAASTCGAVGGFVLPYIRMSGRPLVEPMSPMPLCRESAELVIEPDEPEAMPAGPSEPAHAGVMTAAVAAMTTIGRRQQAGQRPRLAAATGPQASSPGRARIAAAMTISRISSIEHTKSRPPQASTVLVSGPIGSLI